MRAMVFSSITFLFCFLPVVLSLHLFPGRRWRNVVLLTANLLFYFWGEGGYILVLLVSILGNYLLGLLVERTRGGRASAWAVTGAVIFNLGQLIAFKYAGFLLNNLNRVTHPLHLPPLPVVSLHLPIGISFFTFQALSYILDVHRGDVGASRSLLSFAVYKSLFPQLIAGPIVRYRDVARQMYDRVVTVEGYVSGIRRFVIGLGKKVIVANTVAVLADRVFALPPATLGPAAAWLGVLAYTVQIYFDFSGYSDMAIGLGRMLGFTFLENFRFPYAAASVQEFWRRWHISLSSWFRDYLYIPLGGNRRGELRTIVNLMAVFTLCGFWHGAAWTFLVWGAWHGFFLSIERLAPVRAVMGAVPAVVRHLYTALVVVVGWVFFRADSLDRAAAYLVSMAGLGAGPTKETLLAVAATLTPKVILALLVGLAAFLPIPVGLRERFAGTERGGVPAALAWPALAVVFSLSVLMLAAGTYNPFIYFRF
jgi:alginate O-acetyltransferase complex protein AlgI